MPASTLIFYLLASLAIASALMVILAKNPIQSCLYLVLTMFAIAGNYVLLNAQFLAIVQIIVYAGAIMVLFLFTIMMLNLNDETQPMNNPFLKFAGAIAGGSLLLLMVAALKKSTMVNGEMQLPSSSQVGLIKNLGKVLFTDYVLPFEVISILILVGMIGAVMLGKKETVKTID